MLNHAFVPYMNVFWLDNQSTVRISDGTFTKGLMESRAAPPSQKFTDKLSARTLSVPIPRVSY